MSQDLGEADEITRVRGEVLMGERVSEQVRMKFDANENAVLFAQGTVTRLTQRATFPDEHSLALAFADNKKLDDCMFAGGPGLGKSALANVLACEMASGFHELLAQSVSNIGELNAVHRACDLEQLDEIGLGPNERRYLEILSQGSTRLNVIGSTLGLAPATITEVIEPFLIRSGLVTKDKNSLRQLTSEGWKHIQKDKHDEQ